MIYYSTNKKAPVATLEKAVVKGLAEDRGLYMPEQIRQLPKEFFDNIQDMSFQELSYRVADAFFGEDVDAESLKRIVYDTLSFDCPVKRVTDNIYSLELFHGPTLAFKDVGARFMARLLQYFIKKEGETKEVNVLVATSGDTGSAVANGFLGVEGIHVYVLYPKGKVSPIQECQFTTLGKNITAIEVDGVFDDCQALVKSAFMDEELNNHMKLTSANSINVARFLPQSFYYFNAYARMKALGLADNLVMCVPSGNFGNICSALFGRKMGLPVKTLANAMDVGDPSNFARIWDLYGHDLRALRAEVSGATYTDGQIAETIRDCYARTGYVLDPHGACGYQALKDLLKDGEVGVFCETAHPAKFKEKVDEIIGIDVEIPERLADFMKGTKQSVPLGKDFAGFKKFLMEQ